jgi:electron transfer flavoprotein alpha subunit
MKAPKVEADASAMTQYLSEELTVSSRPDLSSAPRVVSGGRALKSQESFNQILDPLADALNAGEHISYLSVY